MHVGADTSARRSTDLDVVSDESGALLMTPAENSYDWVGGKDSIRLAGGMQLRPDVRQDAAVRSGTELARSTPLNSDFVGVIFPGKGG